MFLNKSVSYFHHAIFDTTIYFIHIYIHHVDACTSVCLYDLQQSAFPICMSMYLWMYFWWAGHAEFRSCVRVKVEVAVLGSPSLTVRAISVDVKQQWTWTVRHRAQGLCESRSGRSGLPVPNSPYSLCGRKATLNKLDMPQPTDGTSKATTTKWWRQISLKAYTGTINILILKMPQDPWWSVQGGRDRSRGGRKLEQHHVERLRGGGDAWRLLQCHDTRLLGD